jgi:hypothetical protein
MISLYLRSVGPVYFGIAWAPIVIAGIILAVLLGGAIPDPNTWRDESMRDSQTGRPLNIDETSESRPPGAGKFFWILIVMMIIAILIGMINPPVVL